MKDLEVSQSLGHHCANDMIRDEVMPDDGERRNFESTDLMLLLLVIIISVGMLGLQESS